MKIIERINKSSWLKRTITLMFILLIFGKLNITIASTGYFTENDIRVIPHPQQIALGGENFEFGKSFTITIDDNASDADKFTAEEFLNDVESEWGLSGVLSLHPGTNSIILTQKNVSPELKEQGYELEATSGRIIIKSTSEAGLFYGTQTLLQLIKKTKQGIIIPGISITDWPDIKNRAIHYDTKHHQDKASYVKKLIKDLARYKVNQLVWEWEDKLEYKSHPEIGAPGAFTIEEIQELTRYASKYHVELIPLVQGLGHVSFILKWEKYFHLRELENSNWEFCPLKEGTYDLLFDLWEEAIEATPGSRYIHIGSDETYELGLCENCKAKANEIGNSGVYHLFVKKAAEHLKKLGRKVMVWERPMGWEMSMSPVKNFDLEQGLVLTESYEYETPDFRYANQAHKLGYEVYVYDPNPKVIPLFVPYYSINGKLGNFQQEGSLADSYKLVSAAAMSGAFDGMINTSWDDNGMHTQMWMMAFAVSAEYAWSGSKPSLSEFETSFYTDYYGQKAVDMEELFRLLNEGAFYYSWSFERNVWHYGNIGKTHLPDLPRDDAIEYDPFWNNEYKEKVEQSRSMKEKMNRALTIINSNQHLEVKNSYDFELFRTIAELVKHTCLTYLDLSLLENSIRDANANHFISHELALSNLIKAKITLENSLKRRAEVYSDLSNTWEKSRLEKGMSTETKKLLFAQDRARHFANRKPDMSYLIYDEELLDMEGYLKKLEEYITYYKERYLK